MVTRPAAAPALCAFVAMLLAGCGGSGSSDHVAWTFSPPCASNPCVTTVAGSGETGNVDGTARSSAQATDTATDAAGNRYVADTRGNRILKTTPDGATTVLAGTGSSGDDDGEAGSASFSMPSRLAIGADGALYVADMGNRKIRRISLE